MNPTQAEIETRAQQLFEEETGRPWGSDLSEGIGDKPAATDEERRQYLQRAENELKEIDEEGHS